MWEPEQRESDRYPHETVRQQLEDVVGWFPAHPNGTAAILLLGGLLLVWRLITPWGVLGLADLRPGECLYVRTASARSTLDARPGNPDEVRAALVVYGAEPAPCDGSHTHEVAGLVDLDEHDGSDVPGATEAAGAPPAFDRAVLLAQAEDACAAALPAYLDLAPGTSSTTWVGFAVIPTERQWAEGTRVAACLVTAADGRFPTVPARGSAR